jgi:hypothetical protein
MCHTNAVRRRHPSPWRSAPPRACLAANPTTGIAAPNNMLCGLCRRPTPNTATPTVRTAAPLCRGPHRSRPHHHTSGDDTTPPSPRNTLLSKRPPKLRDTDHHGADQPPMMTEDTTCAMEPPTPDDGEGGGGNRRPAPPHVSPTDETTRSGRHGSPPPPSSIGKAVPQTGLDLHNVKEGRAPPPPSLAAHSGCAGGGLQQR